MNQNGILVDLYSIDFFDFPHTLATSGKWWFFPLTPMQRPLEPIVFITVRRGEAPRHPTQCAQVRAGVVSKREPVFQLAALIPSHPSVY